MNKTKWRNMGQVISCQLSVIRYFYKTAALIFLLLLLGGLFTSSSAQVAPLSDQYLLNPFQANPAIAGTERYMPLNINTRQQWIGLNRAPSTQSISIHRRIRAKDIRFTPTGFINKGKNSFGRIGIGGGVFNYNYGAVSHTGVHLDYAYHVFVGNGRLAFGLAPVFFQYSLNKSGFTLPDGNNIDPLISNDPSESLLFLDVNAGMHYYDDVSYAGFSIIQLLNSTVQFGDLSFESLDQMSMNSDLARSMYAYYGRYITFNKDFSLEPSVWLKYNLQSGFRADANAIFHLQDTFQAGISYRLQESLGMLVGVKLDNLEIRYVFEVPVSAQVPNRYTSHQVMIRFNLGEPID
ncbi:MAG: type IX secretion system membrane protein PorP/SprF [Bacteroidetes bacterium]|jgi:type IX secretion system PorP/SprF family membrane protein|nr:type IX secretion system membrane protein PorP/SprF [Bacteroidota bacterium]MBT4400652.1 type IX secretion system membrane protein PorP/SprF [Bacteroidota bacterium]MBT5425690.1 type IX secretion system membrane protein PorP/SprF [Bacteroidota bacterium]MBT7093624.1 type IX secretion system membrane protein PorP/SprF [Bacteroidota bacterium]